MKRSVKVMVLTAMLAALYFVLSLTLKIPLRGNISLDLGYISLTVAAVFLGAIPAAIVGGLGAAIESILLSPYGLSIGWVVMNVCIGLICGYVLHKKYRNLRTERISAVITILVAVLIGVSMKTLIECTLYSIPVIVKLPKSVAAFLVDSFVMIFGGIPLSDVIKDKVY